MPVWSEFVDVIYATLVCVSTALGGSMPDAALAGCCALVTALSVALGPTLSASQRLPAILVPAVLTLVFLSRMAAGVSLYALASGLVGLRQALLVGRRAAHLAAA
jgi:hypothetical protein